MQVTVYTSIVGGKDELIDDQVKGNAKWIAYLDKQSKSKTWEVRPAYDRFRSPRRNSRAPKILSHQFIETEYSIWIDGNLKLLTPPEKIVETYLADHDIALFRHPDRTCLYDEAIVCAAAGLDDPRIIQAQVLKYEREGFAPGKGLCECNFIVRRNTPKVQAFENAWWSEHCVESVRDQISFMYAADKVGMRVNVIDAGWDGTIYFATKAGVIGASPHLTPRNDEI